LFSHIELKVLSPTSQSAEEFKRGQILKWKIQELKKKKIKVFIFVSYREVLGPIMLVRLTVILVLHLNDTA